MTVVRADDVAKLVAENERLRQALRDIIEEFIIPATGEYDEADPVVKIARAALAEQTRNCHEAHKLKATGDEPLEVVNSGTEDWIAAEEFWLDDGGPMLRMVRQAVIEPQRSPPQMGDAPSR